jgi:hypothetical protein
MAPFPLWDLVVFLAAQPPGTALLGYLGGAIAAEIARRSGPPGLG